MFCFQSLLWKFSLKLCFRLLSTRFRLRLESGRADSGRSYQSKSQTTLKATDHLGGLFYFPSAVPRLGKLVGNASADRLALCGFCESRFARAFAYTLDCVNWCGKVSHAN